MAPKQSQPKQQPGKKQPAKSNEKSKTAVTKQPAKSAAAKSQTPTTPKLPEGTGPIESVAELTKTSEPLVVPSQRSTALTVKTESKPLAASTQSSVIKKAPPPLVNTVTANTTSKSIFQTKVQPKIAAAPPQQLRDKLSFGVADESLLPTAVPPKKPGMWLFAIARSNAGHTGL